MFRQVLLGLVVLSLVVALSVRQILPAFAQDTPDTATTTASIVGASVTLGMEESPVAAGSKATGQAPEKAVPAEANQNPTAKSKHLIFLPVVSMSAGAETANEISAAFAGWTTILYERFEDTFPSAGWTVSDCNLASGGWEQWGKTGYKYHLGGGSGWAAKDGLHGVYPDYYPYPNNACSLMVYGPFSLAPKRTLAMPS